LQRTPSCTLVPYTTLFRSLQQLYEQGDPLIPGSQKPSTMLKNPALEPLRTRSIEFGTDLRFFKNKVMLDVAVYKSNTYNQQLTRSEEHTSELQSRENLVCR